MSRRFPVTLLAAALALTACGAPEPDGGAAPPVSIVEPSPTAAPPTPSVPDRLLEAVGGPMYDVGAALVAEYVGLGLADFDTAVTADGYGPVRVAWNDGEFPDLTEELTLGRVNVAVVDRDGTEVVVDAFVENDGSDPRTAGQTAGDAAIVSTTEGVAYYPACGNERLEHDGDTWYIIGWADFGVVDEMFSDQWDELSAVTRESSPAFGPSGFVRVADPGPGDDVGTLVVWDDDVARWVSDSGNLDVWLVRNELEVLWVC